jgi:transcriptional regulator with XRE-family HTH domain
METRQMYSNLDDFASWLKMQLEEKHLTVLKLSQMSGVHHNTLHNYIHGRCEPTLYSARCIANALGYDLGVMKNDNK